MRAVAPDKAPRRAVEMDPLATALPIADVINQGRPCIVAAYPQSEPAIGTGDGFGRHGTRPRASQDGVGKHTEMGRERLPHFGGGFERGVRADRTLGIGRSSAVALAESHGIPKLQVNAVLTGLVEQIAKHLKKGKRICFASLGILHVRKHPARMGRNPATGETIKITASKKIAFRAAKDLEEAV
jgi:DNA-binding protein HU-beta